MHGMPDREQFFCMNNNFLLGGLLRCRRGGHNNFPEHKKTNQADHTNEQHRNTRDHSYRLPLTPQGRHNEANRNSHSIG